MLMRWRIFFFLTMLYVIGNSDQYSVPCYYCPNCGRRYKHYRHMKSHLRYECGVQKQFTCLICDKNFARNSTLRCHLVNVHKQLWTGICAELINSVLQFSIFFTEYYDFQLSLWCINNTQVKSPNLVLCHS